MSLSAISRYKRAIVERASSPNGLFLLAYCVLLPIYLVPIFVTRILPGLDLPFHLSLVDMLHKVTLPDSPYAAIFDGSLRISPYLGYLLVLWLLSFVIPVGLAHKLVFAVYIATLPLAMGRLLAACGRSRVPAILGFPICYNMAVHYGFMSFALSLPLLLLPLAELAHLATPQPSPTTGEVPSDIDWLALLRLALLAAALFLFHLLHYLFFLCVAVGAIVLSFTSLKRRLVMIAGLVPSFLLFAYWQLQERAAATVKGPGLEYALRLFWQSRRDIHLSSRLGGLSAHLLKGFSDGADRRGAALLLALLTAFVVTGFLGYQQKKPAVAPRFVVLGPIALAGGFLAYLTLPHHMREFDVMTLFPRFSVTLGALLVLAVPAALSRHSLRTIRLCTAAALALSIYYGVELIRHYYFFAHETADFLRVLDQTPAGGKITGLVFDRHSRVLVNESLLVGLPAYYPVERRAPTSFVDILYCDMKHMPCRTQKLGLRPPAPQPWAPRDFRPELALPYFDYIFVRRGPKPEELFAPVADRIELWAKAGSWAVYRKRADTPRNGAENAAPQNMSNTGTISNK